jgi:hypothetical protein
MSVKYNAFGRRGMKDPTLDMESFMIRDDLCEDPKADEEKKRRKREMGMSPGSEHSQDAKTPKRKKVCSPKRMKYEKFFEGYLHRKFVDNKLVEEPALENIFDTTTKPEGTFNVKVNERARR